MNNYELFVTEKRISTTWQRDMSGADKVIRNLPDVDAVEVVRCGQCKHATEDIIVEGVCYCHKIQQGMFLDGFCSYGEGRTDK